MAEQKKKYKPIPAFNDHGGTCKGHGNWMLDCTFENEDDRYSLGLALDSYAESRRLEALKAK